MTPRLISSSELYRDSRRVPFASRLSSRARRLIYRRFEEIIQPHPSLSVLDVGVTCDTDSPESNFFERFYPYKGRLTCVGTEDGSHLEREYPGVRVVSVQSGAPLPFATASFDVVFSNAVLEHCGSRDRQAFFLQEIARVSRRFFLATPNRWFPVEVHTGLPLLHFLPAPLFRSLLGRTRYKYWADIEHLNLLGVRTLERLVPGSADVTIELLGVGWGVFASNLVAHGRTR